jgi:hypothetical protein
MEQLELPLTGQLVDFSTALTWLKAGERVKRGLWHEDEFLEVADIEYLRAGKRLTHSVVDRVESDGSFAAWAPEPADLMANDWILAP